MKKNDAKRRVNKRVEVRRTCKGAKHRWNIKPEYTGNKKLVRRNS